MSRTTLRMRKAAEDCMANTVTYVPLNNAYNIRVITGASYSDTITVTVEDGCVFHVNMEADDE